jgi:hypothetical protein
MEWILKLVAAGDEGRCVDIMEISKPERLTRNGPGILCRVISMR